MSLHAVNVADVWPDSYYIMTCRQPGYTVLKELVAGSSALNMEVSAKELKIKMWIPQRHVQASRVHYVKKVAVTMTFDRQPPKCHQFILPFQYVYAKLNKVPESLLEVTCLQGRRVQGVRMTIRFNQSLPRSQEFLCDTRGLGPKEPEMIGALLGITTALWCHFSLNICRTCHEHEKKIISQSISLVPRHLAVLQQRCFTCTINLSPSSWVLVFPHLEGTAFSGSYPPRPVNSALTLLLEPFFLPV